MTYPRLELEKKEDPADEFITLAVRMKLDLAGCRISLEDWNQTNRFTRYVLWSFATRRQGRNFAQSYVDLFACKQLDNSENEG